MTDPKPKQKSSRRSRAKREPKPRGRPTKHDWTQWRRLYMRGDDRVSLESLSLLNDAPSLGQLKRRSSAEDWPSLRAELRVQSETKIREIDADLKTEVRGRHAKVGKALITLGVRALAHLRPEQLEAVDAVRLLKIGTDIERKALGMEEINVRLGRLKTPDDLDKLGEAELWQMAGMLPPEEGEDDDG